MKSRRPADVAAGLARENDPLLLASDAEAVAAHLFGGPVDVLLHAGAARADEVGFGKGHALNPGSATAPPEGERASFLRLKVTPDGLSAASYAVNMPGNLRMTRRR